MGNGLLISLWVVALCASAIVVLGAIGLLPFLLVLAVWGGLSYLRFRTSLALLFLPLALFFVMAEPILNHSPMAYRYSCMNGLQQLSVALLNYEDQNGRLPSAHTDIGGKPAHSWRTALLPQMEMKPLFERLDFSEPWDGPHNSSVWEGVPLLQFKCSTEWGSNSTFTSYFAVVDPRTMWPPDHPMTYQDIKDGTVNTIMLIEAPDRGIDWPDPRDLSFDEAVDLLTTVPDRPQHEMYEGFLYKPAPCLNVAMAVSQRCLPLPLPRDLAESLLTAAGGEEPWDGKVESYYVPELDWVKIAGLSAFVILSLLPAGVFFSGRIPRGTSG